MPRLRPAVSLLLALPAVFPACSLTGDEAWSGFHAQAGAGGYLVGLSGDIQTTSGALQGSFDTDAIGQDDAVLGGMFEVRAGLAPLELGLSGFEYSQTGRGTYTGSFLGQNFTGAVRSDFEITNFQATLGLDVVNTEVVRVGALLGLDYLSVDLQLDDTSGLTSARLDESLPVPVLGLRADASLGEDWRVGGQIAGLAVNVNDFDVTFLDGQAGVHWEVFDHGEVFLGWRLLDLDFKGPLDSTTDADVGVRLSGPFLGVGIAF